MKKLKFELKDINKKFKISLLYLFKMIFANLPKIIKNYQKFTKKTI